MLKTLSCERRSKKRHLPEFTGMRKGFTLVELLLTMGVVAILATVSTISLVNYRSHKTLDLQTQEIVSVLRDTQNRSITQENGKPWGVHFENPSTGSGFYALFTGSTYSASNIVSTTTLNSAVEFLDPITGVSKDVAFSAITGRPNASTTLVIALKSNSSILRTITISQNGLVAWKEGGWCGQSITDSRDSKTYATVQIGTQCWMKQGLNIGTRISGSSNQGTSCASIQKYCYNDIDANCDSTNNPNYPDGGLYQWNQAMCGSTTPGVKGICPTGWHFATDAEWTTLVTYLGGASVAGTKLKPNGTSGFEGNLAGDRITGGFINRGAIGRFWSSSQSDATHAWDRRLHSDDATVYRDYDAEARGVSVRCLKD